MKKKANKPKVRGVVYVSQALNKYFKSRFPTIASAKDEAKQFVKEQKEAGLKVTVKALFERYKKKRTPKELIFLPESLSQPDNYFSLVDYPERILGVSKKIFFKSALSPSALPRIQGGTLIQYEDYFSDFVSYCNDLKKFAVSESQYDEDWYVRCVPDEDKITDKSNKNKHNLYFRIISCDASGNPFDYGFNPKKPESKPTDTILSPKEETVVGPTPPATVATPSTQVAVDTELEIQKLRAKTAEEERKAQELKVLLRLYEDKLISGKEFKEKYDKLT